MNLYGGALIQCCVGNELPAALAGGYI